MITGKRYNTQLHLTPINIHVCVSGSFFVPLQIMKQLILFLLILTASPAMAGRDSVYVSTRPNAYAYHRTLKCEGLQRTTRKIIKIPRQQAERSRRPCRYCYRREVITIGGEIKGDSIVSGD